MIHTTWHDTVCEITIDRPERRNALDLEALHGLDAALDDAEGGGARVVVVDGAGGHFCAGADLTTVEDDAFVVTLTALLRRLRALPVPVVAGVEGAALGAGTQLAVASDLRTATPDASFGIPAAKLGLMVDQWTVQRLISMTGQSVARSMLIAAEVLTGEAAVRIGFAQRTGGVEVALDWATQIARLAPLTMTGHKVGCNEAEDLDLETDAYRTARAAAWSSADLQEGLAAFGQRRRPGFSGS